MNLTHFLICWLIWTGQAGNHKFAECFTHPDIPGCHLEWKKMKGFIVCKPCPNFAITFYSSYFLIKRYNCSNNNKNSQYILAHHVGRYLEIKTVRNIWPQFSKCITILLLIMGNFLLWCFAKLFIYFPQYDTHTSIHYIIFEIIDVDN